MKTIDRYILGEFVKTFLLSLATLIAFYEMVVFIDYVGYFVKYEATADQVARYMLFKVPMAVFHVTPICVLLSALLTTSSLARFSEIIVMKSVGMSMMRISAPIILGGAIISTLAFLDSEYLFHLAARESNRVYYEEIKKKPRKSLYSNDRFWYRADDGAIWNIGNVDMENSVLRDVSIFRFDKSRASIASRISSVEGRFDGSSWVFHSFIERSFDKYGAFTENRSPLKKMPTGFVEREDFTKVKLDPEEMNRGQIGEYIADIREKGYDATKYIVEKHAKLAFPLISLVMPLIAIPMGNRSSRSGGAMVGVAVALVIGGLFWFMFSMGLAFGRAGRLPPELAAYGAHAIFASVGLFMLLSKRQ